ncbi:M1 family metallopeptidase [Candidatus Nitrospira allomarina]|uniref:M1 family aminopeptidase n=1 Tax=Candidatus Nitrospira allomarina TaxID=3020900 RepID=A0AA96GIN3_9BACT|nr:M1 family aminopeptidase [Candidatus Nitrospira allomarina]WNM58391.1 M1 family aminopeptidase [Candidatus Nitrospira allomarina]
MNFIHRIFPQAIRVPLFVLGLIMLCLATANPLQAQGLMPIHHELHIELNPGTHAITGSDTVHLPPSHRANSSVSFILHPQLSIDLVEFNGTRLPIPHLSETAILPSSTRRVIEIPLPPLDDPDQPAALTVTYHGQIDDSPKASGGLRFVRPDDTNGHIGPNGVYLTYETFWHPTWEQTLSTYDLTLSLPSDWETITQGREVINTVTDGRRTTQWKVNLPSEALTLAANHFVVQKQEWRGIQLATYLFPEDAHLAPQYIEATIDYLQMYTNLLGPYPFTKFAVVENFFPSGLGLPSFTLLGEGVIRRGYTQPYSLGHEIVHSWFGNSVFNDFAQGNWVEGLTTYLSNYYYDEAKGHQQEAFNTRRRMVYEYNLYAEPDKEYPVRAFHHKETRQDNAIGYQKTAMVFHMLRQEMGEGAFFKGVRGIIQDGTGTSLEWNDLLGIFSQAAERDLGWFFQQWIDQPGAPIVKIQNILVQEDPTQQGQFTLTGTILQAGPMFTIRLPLHLDLQGGVMHDVVLKVDRATQPFTLPLPASPITLAIDPEHHVLLHLLRAQIPPMLNKWETDTRRILIRPQTLTNEEAQSLEPLFHRLKEQPGIETIQADDPVIAESASYLVIGPSARRLLESDSFNSCEKSMDIHPGHLSLEEQTFEGPEMAFLISCAHPQDATHTVTFFFGWSPEAVKPVSRLLFFYGWDSYLVFKQGKVIARGMFQPVHSTREIIRHSP